MALILLFMVILQACRSHVWAVDLLNLNFEYAEVINLGKEDVDGETFRFHDVATKTDNDSFIITREVRIDSLGLVTVAASRLIFPKGKRNGSVVTMDLEVDHSKILPEYLQAMAAVPFCTGALVNDSSVEYRVLSIGLGMGIVNGFLHNNFPNVNVTVVELSPAMVQVAKKYFGLKEDSRQRVIVDDGIKFIRSASGREDKFDVIYVDACYNKFPNTTIVCPVADFLKEDNIFAMKNVLKDSGVLAASALFTDNSQLQEVVTPYKKVFGKCTLLSYMPITTTRVLVCGKNVPDDNTLKQSIPAQLKEFGFDYSTLVKAAH